MPVRKNTIIEHWHTSIACSTRRSQRPSLRASDLGLYRRQTAKRAQKRPVFRGYCQMAAVQFENDALSVDAAVIDQGLGPSPLVVQASIRDGKLTAVCERGIETDAWRYGCPSFSKTDAFASSSTRTETRSSA